MYDWFNYVDFTYNEQLNVGLPLAQDNEARWEEMGEFIYNPNRAASMADNAGFMCLQNC